MGACRSLTDDLLSVYVYAPFFTPDFACVVFRPTGSDPATHLLHFHLNLDRSYSNVSAKTGGWERDIDELTEGKRVRHVPTSEGRGRQILKWKEERVKEQLRSKRGKKGNIILFSQSHRGIWRPVVLTNQCWRYHDVYTSIFCTPAYLSAMRNNELLSHVGEKSLLHFENGTQMSETTEMVVGVFNKNTWATWWHDVCFLTKWVIFVHQRPRVM